MAERDIKSEIKEGDLVRIRMEWDYGGPIAVWWRVMFIDNDETFIGRLERCYWMYEKHKKGEDIRFHLDEVDQIWKGGQFCYDDNVTLCDCRGLCRNKM